MGRKKGRKKEGAMEGLVIGLGFYTSRLIYL
jgi:hypothetical protein